MKCPRCLNEDDSYFYYGSKGWICRRCISFKRVLIEEEMDNNIDIEISEYCEEYLLKYPLTALQKEISFKCKNNIDNNDVLIEAICGSGKTEIVMETIAYMLKTKRKVCFAISRKQVVLELYERLRKVFTKAKVVRVCQGYTSDIYGDIVICTTHQCYRYYQFFDCLILDECDAFPYKNNVVLEGIVRSSCIGHMVYLTATIDDYLKSRIAANSIVHLTLNKRPHGHDLIVPKCFNGYKWLLIIRLIQWINKQIDHQIIVFVPTIKMSKYLYYFLKMFYPCEYVNSKSNNNDIKIQAFKDKKYHVLIATTILERGITIENVNVAVLFANHRVFDEASLVQISGRVGRSFKYPDGECLFLCDQRSNEVDKCIRKCEAANA